MYSVKVKFIRNKCIWFCKNFKIIIPDCFLRVAYSPAKNVLIDSSHLFMKVRNVIFI